MTIQTGYVPINDARLYYEIAGDGPNLVFIHAGIADRRMWDGQFDRFARHYRVMRYDMRGFGLSEPVAGTFMHREDLRGLLDVLAIDQATLVGCSMGGSMAIDFTLAYPDRVDALVVVGSNPSGFEGNDYTPPQWEQAVAAWKAGDIEATAEFEMQIWVDGGKRTPDQVDPAVRQLALEMNLIALRNEARELGTVQQPEPAIDRLDEVRTPLLAVVGDLDDPDMIAAAEFMAANIAGARQAIIPGTAHLPSMEKPAQFNQIVLDFLLD